MPDERRPSFARDFPRQPALDALVDAFARGNYAQVRAKAPEVERSTEDEAVRAAARMLVERTRPDRLAVALIAVAAALLVAISAYWAVHARPPPGTAPVPTTPPVEHVR